MNTCRDVERIYSHAEGMQPEQSQNPAEKCACKETHSMTRTLLNVICAMMLALLLPSAQAAGESDVVRAIRESGRTEKFAETLYVDHSAPPAPLPAEQDRGYIVFRRHWMDLVFPIPSRRGRRLPTAWRCSPAPRNMSPSPSACGVFVPSRGCE